MRRIVQATALALSCAACSSTEPARGELPGTYTLVSMNGQTLPYTTSFSTTTSAEMTIRPDGTYSETIAYRRPPGFVPAEGETSVEGVWSDSSGTFTFLAIHTRASPAKGTLTGRTLTLRYPGDTLVWQK